MSEWIGWVATAIFAASYFFKDPVGLRRLQALAASLWIVYGVLIAAPPVIVANVIVAVMAIASSWRQRAHAARGDPSTATDA
ncbi:MAG TPA: YgjV family protein [Vicinamibacteria bacterium]|nr:YgjV family protein [Vicinamibacteria bacterium]